MGLPINWLSHLPKEKQGEFADLIRNSTQVLGRFRDILIKEVESLESVEERRTSYSNPSWAYEQAFLNGQRSQLKDLLRYFDFMDK